MHTPTLRQLEYLIALADYQSFSKAAFACSVTQSTLSAGIKELETLLGQNVVDRSTRKRLSLTPLGLVMVEDARDILERTRAMSERANQAGKPMSGPLRLGIIPTIAPYLLPRILPVIQKQYPHLELYLHEDLSANLVQKATQAKLDLLLLAFPYDTPGMTQMKLYEEPFMLAYATGKEPNINPLTHDAIQGHNILLLEDGHCLRDHALQACKLSRPGNPGTFSATSLPTLIQMVSHGYGMTLLPQMACQAEILPSNIQTLAFQAPKPTRTIGLAWRTGSPRKNDYSAIGKLLTKIWQDKQG